MGGGGGERKKVCRVDLDLRVVYSDHGTAEL